MKRFCCDTIPRSVGSTSARTASRRSAGRGSTRSPPNVFAPLSRSSMARAACSISAQRQLVARLVVVGPVDEAVLPQDDPVDAGVLLDGARERQAEVEARPLPGQPGHLVAVDLAHEPLAVLRGRQGDHRVRMGVVDVLEGDEPVQRGVDRARPRVEVVDRVGVGRHHPVLRRRLRALVRVRLVERAEHPQPVHVQRREVLALGGPQVAPRTLHPQDLDVLARERVGHGDLAAGVPAPRVGDALVRSQQVGAVHQALHRIEAGGRLVVPAVANVTELARQEATGTIRSRHR